MNRRCPDCRGRKGTHKRGCWRRCPVCSKGVVVEMARNVDPSKPNFRRFDCGHVVHYADLLRVLVPADDEQPPTPATEETDR